MTRAVLNVTSEAARAKAVHWLTSAALGFVVTFQRNKRSIPQNSRQWAILTTIAEAMPWHGVKLTPDDWKLIFMDALNREMRIVPNLDGTGFVNLGTRSSQLTKEEHSDFTALMEAFAAKHGIDLHEKDEAA